MGEDHISKLLGDIEAEKNKPKKKKSKNKVIGGIAGPIRPGHPLFGMIKRMIEETESLVEVERVKVKPEWKEMWEKLDILTKEHEAAERKHLSYKDLFWRTIENDLQDFRDMRYDRETDEIVIMEESDDEEDDG